MFTPTIRHRLLLFAVAMIVAMGAVHTLIAANDNRITLLAKLALAAVAVGYFAFYRANYLLLRRVRYGLLAAHSTGFVIVNGSYWAHAGYLWTSGQGEAVNADWYGLLFGMGAVWGLGLTIHAIAARAGRGFDDAIVA